jgi:hypothetical protein
LLLSLELNFELSFELSFEPPLGFPQRGGHHAHLPPSHARKGRDEEGATCEPEEHSSDQRGVRSKFISRYYNNNLVLEQLPPVSP